MGQQENKLLEGYEKVSLDSEQEVQEQVKRYFEKAWIYAVLDFAVGFGIYKEGRFLLKLDNQKKLVSLDWDYLHELRIFNSRGELRLTSLKEQWVGRFRGGFLEGKTNDEESEEFFIDEKQKLWGKVKKSESIGDLGWSLLASDRGTRIWVPKEFEEQEEVAICVRKFMKTSAAGTHGLVYQTDMCMMEFCLWSGEGKGGSEKNG